MSLPDYVTDANAVMKDDSAAWRYGRAPDYSKTRQVWAESKFPTNFILPFFHRYGWLGINLYGNFANTRHTVQLRR